MSAILWQRRPEEAAATRIMAPVREPGLTGPDAIDRLRRRPADHPEAFWQRVWQLGEVRAGRPAEAVLRHADRMPGAEWFPGARPGFAENLLRRDDATPASRARGATATSPRSSAPAASSFTAAPTRS
jgi:acetoacetyl-CoA synthetase